MAGETPWNAKFDLRTVGEKIGEPSGLIVNRRTVDWSSINWKKAHRHVKRLRQRIYQATYEQDWKRVRSLQKLMLRSRANLLTSIRRVSQINRGKSSPGVDAHVALTNRERGDLAGYLADLRMWEPLPTRRVYIPKSRGLKSRGKKRPLGIPTLIDRCQQAIVRNALEPCWESRFEGVSYGFRPGRSVHDAIERIYLATKSGSKRVWVLDADIKGCFDNIDHEALLTTIGNFPARGLIRKWLKAGFMEDGVFHATLQGTPQGGVISPLLANIALHGMEEALGIQYRGGTSSTFVKRDCPVFVRYADDFVALCHTKEDALKARRKIEAFLAGRGLILSDEKTRIGHIRSGFDFLGFNIRSYKVRDRFWGCKTLIKPSKAAIAAHRSRLRELFKVHVGLKQGQLIAALNPVIRGWCYYYRHAVSAKVFADIEHFIHFRQQRWSRRAHPRKLKHWWMRKYFGRHYLCPTFSYAFMDKTSGAFMAHPVSVKIERWVMVKHRNSPDDPALAAYWQKRATSQGHSCPTCGQSIYNGDTIRMAYRDGDRTNGSYKNLVLIHGDCRKSFTQGLA